MNFNTIHNMPIHTIPVDQQAILKQLHNVAPVGNKDQFTLQVGKDFNLVPVGGGDISYNKASNNHAGQRDWKIHDVRISAELANSVYEEKNTLLSAEGKSLKPLSAELKNTGLTEKDGLFSHQSTDGQAMAWSSHDAIYIAFRGTASLKDVKQDALLAVSNRSQNAFDNFMLDAAKLAKSEGKKLVVTGHSLGGHHVNAFATKAALDKKFESLKDASFIGFASPTFSREANVLNIGMKNDPVFGVLSVSTHKYAPKLWGQPQFVSGLKYGNHNLLAKDPNAHFMANIQKSVDALMQFGRLNTNTDKAFLSSAG